MLWLLLLVETKTAAQHSSHMLQVRDFKGTLFEAILVAGLLVVVVLKSWLVSFLFFDVFGGVVLEGGSKNNNGAADFVSTGG